MNSLLENEFQKILDNSKNFEFFENEFILKKKIERRTKNQLKNYDIYHKLIFQENIENNKIKTKNNQVEIYKDFNEIGIKELENANNNKIDINKIENNKWKLKRVITGIKGWVRCIDIDPYNEYFISGSTDGVIKIWDLATGKLKLSLTGHTATVRDIKISENYTYFYSCDENRSLKCWDLTTNKVIRNFHGHLSGIYTVCLHPSLNILASGGRDATVRLWDMRSRDQIHALVGHDDVINTIIMQNNEPQIISGGGDSNIITWDIIAGKHHKILTNHKKSVRSMTFHYEDYTWISAATDNIKIWKCPEGDFLRNFNNNDNNIKNSICINEDGVLAVGTDNGFLEFWDYETGIKFQSIESKAQPGSINSEKGIFCCKFDKTGLRLMTGECDKTIKVWEPVIKQNI